MGTESFIAPLLWLISPQEQDSGKSLGFGGPGDQNPVCLGGQGNRQTLSRPYSGITEFRVPKGQYGTEGRVRVGG